MSLQIRLAKLENHQGVKTPVMPEGLSPMEQYLFMIRLPAVSTSQTSALTPAQAYQAMTGR